MKRLTLIAALLAAAPLTLAGRAMAQVYEPIPTMPTAPVLSDPVPGTGADYPASAATAGAAYIGPPKEISKNECTPDNPCAMPSSGPRKPGPLVSSLK